MKTTSRKSFYFTAIIFLILLWVLSGSCDKSDLSSAPEKDHLLGSEWKLTAIRNADGTVIQEFQPENCEKCYTIFFETDSSFHSFSSVNELKGSYGADYSSQTMMIKDFGGTKINKTEGGVLFTAPFWEKSIHAFSLDEDILRLYFNKDSSYLRFQLLK